MDLDDTYTTGGKGKKFRLTQRLINDMTKKNAIKRYGKNNERMIAKYIDMTNRM